MKKTFNKQPRTNRYEFGSKKEANEFFKKLKTARTESSKFIKKITSMSDEELDNVIITFHYPNDSMRMLQCNRQGFYDEYGRRRLSRNQIFNNMMALLNDFNAAYFTLG